MKTRKPAGGLPTSASRPGSRRKAVASRPGNTTGNGTGGATRSSACSGDSRAFAESSRASTSLMSCISDSSSSRRSSIHCVALTRPSYRKSKDSSFVNAHTSNKLMTLGRSRVVARNLIQPRNPRILVSEREAHAVDIRYHRKLQCNAVQRCTRK